MFSNIQNYTTHNVQNSDTASNILQTQEFQISSEYAGNSSKGAVKKSQQKLLQLLQGI